MEIRISRQSIESTTKNNATFMIQEAIDQCYQEGGGHVIVSPGRYVCGTITLKDHVHLVLEKGAELMGSPEKCDYVEPPNLFKDGCNLKKGYALISAHEARDISITGEGMINGRGRNHLGGICPFAIRLTNCREVKIKGIQLKNAGAWCCHILNCDDVFIEKVIVSNKDVGNADGFDIDSSRHVVIQDCDIDTHDDAICFKTTANESCSHITINNCQISSRCAGIKFGTESIGDFSHIRIQDNYIYDCGLCAIKLVPVDGGSINDILIEGNRIDNCTGPIFMATGNRKRSYNGASARTKSHIKNVTLKDMDITCRYRYPSKGKDVNPLSGQGIVVIGRPDSLIENILFQGLKVNFAGGVTRRDSLGAESGDFYFNEEYPEHYKVGLLPSAGMFINHGKDIRVLDCKFDVKEKDRRQLIVIKNVENYKWE